MMASGKQGVISLDRDWFIVYGGGSDRGFAMDITQYRQFITDVGTKRIHHGHYKKYHVAANHVFMTQVKYYKMMIVFVSNSATSVILSILWQTFVVHRSNLTQQGTFMLNMLIF